ncbi:cytochrome c1 [Paracoccus aurantiacus]|uniref:Cytochrome c1 n=1 Tax=Paracoccus aurantiacus TaxID=2599412 RepID=A0A5C6S623_9RHOB|nr:cytochrome c1 [Paracoccus aurantiacus]TXB69865.1 cytochrome c1 [Paracoccus aurantiacus]
MTLRIKTLTAVAALTLGAAAWAQDATVVIPVPENPTPAEAAGAVADAAADAAQAVGDAAGDAAAAAADAAADATAQAAEQATDAAAQTDQAASTAADTADTADTANADAEADAVATEGDAAGASASETVAAEDQATEDAATGTATPDSAQVEAGDTVPAPEGEAPAEVQAAEDAQATPDAGNQPAANESADEPAAEVAVEGETAPEPVDSTQEVTAAEQDAPAGDAAETAAETEDAAAPTAAVENAGAEAEQVGEAEAEHAEEAGAGHAEQHIPDIAFSFEGPFGKFDQFQLQRGLQVYTEVCSACHGMKQVALRTLADEGGPALPEDQVRAYAANLDITDPETGEDRPRLPTDHFPTIVQGNGMGPDLSLMAKARAGFHGPYGTGISQLFNGIGGPEYIHAVLTGYNGEEKEQAGSVLYHNAAFAGNWIGMPPPLSDDLVTYEDGTPATVDQMARDVSAFLMWTAEPHMMNRKKVGFVSVIFLIVMASLLYLTNKRLWWSVKHGDH